MNYKLLTIVVIFVLSGCASLKTGTAEKYSELQKYDLAIEALKQSNVHSRIPVEQYESLIQEKKFSELEKLLSKLESNFNSDSSYEWFFLRAFEDIVDVRIPRGVMIGRLNEWVNTKKTYISYAARGFYMAQIGFNFRGSKYISQTSREDLINANQFWKNSMGDLIQSIKINPKFLPSYSELIRIHRNQGNSEQANVILNQALINIPQTYYIRHNALDFLQPKYSGTYEEADKLVEESQAYGEINPRIWSLRGVVSASKGYQCLLEGNYSCALDYYSKALRYGDKFGWLGNQAFCYYKIGAYESAIKSVQRIKTYTLNKKQADNLIGALKTLNHPLARSEQLYWRHFNSGW